MYAYVFLHIEMQVTSREFCIVIKAKIRVNNLPVHSGYNGSNNGRRVNLQLLKSCKDYQSTEGVGNLT